MKREIKFLQLLIAVCFISCSQNNSTTKKALIADSSKTTLSKQILLDPYLITDTSFGKINKAITYTDLQTLFGNNIQDTINFGPEGVDSFTVTKIYSNTPKELTIIWQPDKLHKQISSVECYTENSPYHTTDSLNVGSTLQKLLQANGQKINFYGTGWDYGGIITSYNNGKFTQSNIYFQLASRDDISTKVVGDRELNTDMADVKANLPKIYISKISLSLTK